MNYSSILFPFGKPKKRVSETVVKDLRIEKVLERLSHGPDMLKYDTCYLPLTEIATVQFRHAVFRDLEDETLLDCLKEFRKIMDSLYDMDHEIDTLKNIYMKQCCLIERALLYCQAVVNLNDTLQRANLRSEGLLQFRDDLKEYVGTHEFEHLKEHSGTTSGKVYGMKYLLHIKENRVEVRKYQDEEEYGKEVEYFFSRFVAPKQQENAASGDAFPEAQAKHAKEKVQYSSPAYWQLDPVQEQIINELSELFPAPFSSLEHFMRSHRRFIPAELTAFHEDMGFYLSWMAYIEDMKALGLHFCLPTFEDKGVHFENGYDLMLADRQQPIISNNLILDPTERIMVLTGPNQGGKTTYARMLGQMFYFASLGVPVPCTKANLFLSDQIFTHFERQEEQKSLNGKLRDDIVRIHEILEAATQNSLILINEMFASTTLQDAEWLGEKILEQLKEKGSFCLYVTFINELAAVSPQVVSLISEIGEEESRTYHIVRGNADGKAYAGSIVKKYQLTYDEILERIGSL